MLVSTLTFDHTQLQLSEVPSAIRRFSTITLSVIPMKLPTCLASGTTALAWMNALGCLPSYTVVGQAITWHHAERRIFYLCIVLFVICLVSHQRDQDGQPTSTKNTRSFGATRATPEYCVDHRSLLNFIVKRYQIFLGI
jgi:hypothetical protein